MEGANKGMIRLESNRIQTHPQALCGPNILQIKYYHLSCRSYGREVLPSVTRGLE